MLLDDEHTNEDDEYFEFDGSLYRVQLVDGQIVTVDGSTLTAGFTCTGCKTHFKNGADTRADKVVPKAQRAEYHRKHNGQQQHKLVGATSI